MKKLLIILCLLAPPVFAASTPPPGSFPQVIINGGGGKYDAKTLFDSTFHSIQVPIGTTGNRPSSASTGMLYYDLTAPGFEGYNGSTWGLIAPPLIPAGTNGQVQYNNNGVFGGLTNGNQFTTAGGSADYTQPADNPITATSYTIQSTDKGRVVPFSNTSPIAVTIPAANSGGFTQGFGFIVNNNNSGAVTLTPASGTIGGASSLVCQQGTGVWIRSDGSNWLTDNGSNTCVAIAIANLPTSVKTAVLYQTNISNGGSVLGTGVQGVTTPISVNGTVTKWCISGDVSGSISIDVWKAAYPTIPIIANSIVASAPPSTSSQQYICSSTLTGWSPTVTAGDGVLININSVASYHNVLFQLIGTLN